MFPLNHFCPILKRMNTLASLGFPGKTTEQRNTLYSQLQLLKPPDWNPRSIRNRTSALEVDFSGPSPSHASLPAPGALPNEKGCLGPHPGAHRDARSEHGEEIDLLYQKAGPVLDLAVGFRLVRLGGDCHVGLATAGERLQTLLLACLDHSAFLRSSIMEERKMLVGYSCNTH